MKTFEEQKEDIYKCSKCGLCQKVCPIYKVTGNECTLSRGKFTILNGIANKHISMDKEVMKYVDLCLNCNACKNFCPSNIDARKIFTSFKSEYKQIKNNKVKDFLYSINLRKILFSFVKSFISVFCFLKLEKLCLKNKSVLIEKGSFGKSILLFALTVERRVKRKKTNYIKTQKENIVYFTGCSNKYINPSSKNATLNILEKLGYKVSSPRFECCGLSYYNSGRIKELKKLVNRNLELLPENCDYLITDCASCEFMLRMYSEFADKKFTKKIEILEKKLISIQEFIQNKDINFNLSQQKVTYHKACHTDFELEQLADKMNINYQKMPEYDSCCGFAGSFALKHTDISKKISQIKAQNIINTKADYVLTTCPACIVGLQQGLLENNSQDINVMSVIEFIDNDTIKSNIPKATNKATSRER